MLRLSKYKNKRKKAIAIVTAQVLFHIDPEINSNQEIKELAGILADKTDPVATAFGWTSGNEVGKLILEEGLGTVEFKNRILRYKSGRRLAAKKKLKGLKSTVSSYLSNYSQKSKTYDGLRPGSVFPGCHIQIF